MKPLPALHATDGPLPDEPVLLPPVPLATPSGHFSTANRRAGNCTAHRSYPWLLLASTATAALFCLMYITKPVISPSPIPTRVAAVSTDPATVQPEGVSRSASLLPSGERLPGEQDGATSNIKPTASDPRHALPSPPSATAFEETNLRIQHILTAEAPGGHLDRIDIDVPVLYHSRSLRWTSDEVAEARSLLVRLMDYQEKSRQLRSEGVELLNAWNHLISESIPATELRADSPTLPENQHDAADAPRSAGFMTTESIQIKASGK